MDEQIERRSPMHEHPQSQASDDEISQMLSRLNDPIPRIRAGNAFTLGERHVEAAVQPLLRLLDDDDVMVVGAAARSLGTIGDKQAIPGLASALRRLSDFAGVFKAARYGYGVSTGRVMYERSGEDETSSEPLSAQERHVAKGVDELAQDIDVEIQKLGLWVHAEIMTALAKFGDESAITPIADLLACPYDNPTPRLREDAAKALSELIRKLPVTESTLKALPAIEQRLLSALQNKGSSLPAEQIAWKRANQAVRATIKTVKWKRRLVSKKLGRPTASIWDTILNWFRA